MAKDYSQETIRVKNISGVTWKDRFDGRDYEIIADDTDRIPIGAYWLWFGNPHTRDFEASKEGAKDRYGERLPAVWPSLVEYVPPVAAVTKEEVEEEEDDTPQEEAAFPSLDIPPKKRGPKK
jgi:hypothetical protein